MVVSSLIRQLENLVSCSTALHVFLKGFSLGDGLTGIFIFLWGWVLGVGLSTGGPSHSKLLLSTGGCRVGVNWLGSKEGCGTEGRCWGEGSSRGDEGSDDNLLLKKESNDVSNTVSFKISFKVSDDEAAV